MKVYECPAFKSSDDDHKRNLLDIVKEEHTLCSKCSSWDHLAKDCKQTFTCFNCQGDHLRDLCSIQKLFSCSTMITGTSTLMSLQDININSQTVARCLFDNGSEATTVQEAFAKDLNLPYVEASYKLGGMGGASATYTPRTGGKIYTVPLVKNDGSKVYIEAYSVKEILRDKVGRNEVKLKHEDFPHIPQSTLVKAGESLPKKAVQLSIGNPNLSLQPCCQRGFGCPDCEKDRCLYRSKFGCGWIPLGRFGSEKKLVSNEPEMECVSISELKSKDNVSEDKIPGNVSDRILRLESMILELVNKLDSVNTKVESKADVSTVGKVNPPDVSASNPSGTKSLKLNECSKELVNRLEDVPDGHHPKVVVTNPTKAVPTSDDSLLYSSLPPDPGSLLCLPALTETRPGPRRKGRNKLVTGSQYLQYNKSSI